MVSIFESIDREVNHNLKFWNGPDEISLKVLEEKKIFSENLNFLMPNGSWKQRKVILTRTSMYYIGKKKEQPKKMAIVTWKKLEPFTEASIFEERYGFRLIQGGVFQDFYTKTPDDLEEWLSWLSKVAILSDLEEDYVIIKEIGIGNSAKVYLAQDIQELKEYAIKSINKEAIISNSRSISALINEIKVMRRLNHPFLITLYRVYENEKYIHLILDYVPGGDLFHRILEKNIFPEDKASIFMRNLLEAMDYMHSMNVVHRDLKPENILMLNDKSDFEFKIADFGLACDATEEQLLRCGSPGYVAPEILKKRSYGKKVDIFSAGIILYVILSSRAPFYGKTTREILVRNKECKLYFQDKYWKNVSQEGIDCVLILTDSNPETRPSARLALKHAWFNMVHKSKVYIQPLLIPDHEDRTNEAVISDVFMKRMNDKRKSCDSSPKERIEEEEKLNENLMNKNAKDLLSRLRVADKALNK